MKFYLCKRFLQEFESDTEANTDTEEELSYETDSDFQSDEEEINNFVKELADEKNIKIDSVEIND